MPYRTRAALLAGVWLLAGSGALAQAPEGSSEVAIYVVVEPPAPPTGYTPLTQSADSVKTIPNASVKIRGIAEKALMGRPVRIVVTPPQEPEQEAGPEAEEQCAGPELPASVAGNGPLMPEPPTTMTAVVDQSGGFEASYIPKAYGEHEVEVTGDAGQTGEARFEVVEPELPDSCEKSRRPELEREAKTLTENSRQMADAVCDKQEELPASPAVDQARAKCAAFEKALAEAIPPGEPPPWIHAADHLAALRRLAPEMRTATAGLAGQFDAWKETASRANEAFAGALAGVTKGNVVCDQIDIIINGLKFCDFYVGLVTTPAKFVEDWGKENIPTKLVSMIPAARRTPATQQAIESAWKGIVTFSPSKAKLTGGDVLPAIVANTGTESNFSKGYEFGRGMQTMLFDLSQFVANRFFEKYCQQFQGPVSGTMAAEFYHNAKPWWRYTVEIQGQLTLRYPRDAAGPAIALTGEFTGNATRFRSWDDITMRFPEAKGALFRSVRIEPVTVDDITSLTNVPLSGVKIAGQEVPDLNPLASTLDKGGPVVKGMITPAFFRIPVRGDLRGATLRLELGEAVMDFTEKRVSVVTVLFSVLSLRPHVVRYSLPYQGGHWILSKALDADAGPVEFTVSKVGEQMMLERTFSRDRPNPEARGVYKLRVKACNPGC